ncbi:MAG: aldolase [Burkholderiales bacterium]|nr:aldolase [Burkholderiales bacterium]
MNDVREALTRCAWILADEGHESGLAGQLTARGSAAGTYWTLPLGLAFDEATEAAWLLIDDEMRVRAGDGFVAGSGTGRARVREPNPATRFHLWVYRARADVGAIVHTHPRAVSALAAARVPLVIGHMDATPLFDDLAFLPEWPGLPTADREGEIIAAALGGKHAIVLANHGMLTAGRSVAEATFLGVFMERMARLQLDAAAVGGVKAVDAAEAARARDFLRSDRIMDLTFDAWARKASARRKGIA